MNHFQITLTKRQGDIVEEALRRHILDLQSLADEAHDRGLTAESLELGSTANVARSTLLQVKDSLYNLVIRG